MEDVILNHIPATYEVRPDGITGSAWARWMNYIHDERAAVRPAGYVNTRLGRIYLADGRTPDGWLTVWLARPGMVATVETPLYPFSTREDRHKAAVKHAFDNLSIMHAVHTRA